MDEINEATISAIIERVNDPDWWVEFVIAALAEAGVPDADVWHEDGLLYAESCGDCTCTAEDWRGRNCGPTTAQVDRAFDLLNDTVNRLKNGSYSSGNNDEEQNRG